MHERFAVPVSSGQPSGGAGIDLVGGFLGWRQDRVIDNDINGFRQRRQVGISKVESNRARARPLEHPALFGIREPRDREDFVVLCEFDSDWECHQAAGAGDEYPPARKLYHGNLFLVGKSAHLKLDDRRAILAAAARNRTAIRGDTNVTLRSSRSRVNLEDVMRQWPSILA